MGPGAAGRSGGNADRAPGHRHGDIRFEAYFRGPNMPVLTCSVCGIGYLTGGESAGAQIARSSYLHGPAADRIVARARALREAAGTLSGHALGQDPEDTDALGRPLVGYVIQVFGADEAQAHPDVLLARLAEQ
jgi:S-DNA-T family DNA segregation ATPase FtsK/SpoIIIE